ncbi:Insulin-like growth factor 1 receptor, partial [Halocaridina rubra]
MDPSTSGSFPSVNRDAKPTYCGSKRVVNYVWNLELLRGCEIIEGSLEIILIESKEDISGEWEKYSFPELVQITGFLLIYRVDGLVSLGHLFPNLAVIRGTILHQRYALVIYEALHMEKINLYSLTSILRGSVRIQNNFNLCYISTVDWSLITSNEVAGMDNVFKRNNDYTCPPCNTSECHRCWGSSKCQKMCPPECRGGCTSKGECCHEFCIGGCYEPHNSSACFACRNVSYKGDCVNACPRISYK